MYQSALYSNFHVSQMDFSVKVFYLEKGFSWWFQWKEILLTVFLCCAASPKIASFFFTFYYFWPFQSTLYFDQGRRSCPGSSCTYIKRSCLGYSQISNKRQKGMLNNCHTKEILAPKKYFMVFLRVLLSLITKRRGRILDATIIPFYFGLLHCLTEFWKFWLKQKVTLTV